MPWQSCQVIIFFFFDSWLIVVFINLKRFGSQKTSFFFFLYEFVV